MMATPADFSDALRLLTEKYRNQLPARLAEINDLLVSVQQAETYLAEDMDTLHRAVHSLTGTGATFGLTKLSNVARSLEVTLKECVKKASPLNEETNNTLKLQWEAVKLAATNTDDKPN
jgi:chemotaxis protein histidine kinase CheA